MPKSVNIIGAGASLSLYKHKADNEVWALISMKTPLLNPYINLYFGMHEYDEGADINQSNYPLNEIVKEFDCAYFTNSISYMIAYAIYKGYEEINIYGVDMTGRDEYINQRGSVMYWIGYARAKGITVNLSSEVDKPCFLYGYEPAIYLKNKLKNMKKYAQTGIGSTDDENKKNQFYGMIHAINLIEMEL